MINKSLAIVLIVLFSYSGLAQIIQPGLPFSNQQELRKELSFLSFQQKNIISETNSKLDGQPLFAGYTLPFYGNTLPEWEEIGKSEFVARLGLSVQNAKAINVYFSNFYLSENERVFIYDPQKKIVIGALTKENNGDFLATTFVPGDSLIIEFNANTKADHFPFNINEIGISTKNLFHSERGFGDADNCEILVNCPEGEDWQNEKNGVARILVKEGSSLYWCSGSLVNNTRQDGTPYFLTANHCGIEASSADYSQWIFYFQYESPDCQFPSSEPSLLSMTGAKKMASAMGETNSGSDFKLLLLKDQVPPYYQPYYNGWNRSPSPTNSGVDIHHPEGDLKMISTFLNPAVSSTYLGTTPDPNGHFWKIVWAQTDGGYGVTEGGSSGSPLFNSQGQIVGALTGGRASCSNQGAPDYFGKFSYSWDSNGADSSSQLSVWLSPGNPEIESLSGSNLDTTEIIADFRAEFTDILVGGSVNFINNSSGKISEYRWYFPGGTPDFSEAEEPGSIQYNATGVYEVKLEIKSSANQDQMTRYNYIRVMPSVSSNNGNGFVNINFGKNVPEDLQIEVFDINGQNVQFSSSRNGSSSITVNISNLADDIYFIRTISQEIEQSYKVMIVR